MASSIVNAEEIESADILKNSKKISEDAMLKFIQDHQQNLESQRRKIIAVLEAQDSILNRVQFQKELIRQRSEQEGLPDMFQKTTHYLQKLKSLQTEVIMINNRVARLKQRALALENKKQMKAKEEAEAIAREERLIVKPKWKKRDEKKDEKDEDKIDNKDNEDNSGTYQNRVDKKDSEENGRKKQDEVDKKPSEEGGGTYQNIVDTEGGRKDQDEVDKTK